MSSTQLFTRSLGTAIGNAVDICQITSTGTATYGVYLSVVQSTSLERVYRLKIPYNATGAGVWKRLVPVDKTEKDTRWSVDVQSYQNVATFRLVRTQSGAASATSLQCKITGYAAPGQSLTISNNSTTPSTSNPLSEAGWVLVAHMANTGGMFAGDSDLSSTYSYGTFVETPSSSTSDFYRAFPVQAYEILFITGNGAYWALGKYTEVLQRVTLRENSSSPNITLTISLNGTVSVTVCNILSRVGFPEDPWISLAATHTPSLTIWGENGYVGTHTTIKNNNGGINVYVRPATNTGIYDGALITQIDGKVGINTDAPSYDLDVVGNTNTSGAYKIGGADVLTSSALGSSIASSNLSSVGTLSSLNVNGSVNLTGLSQNTQPGNVVYINTGTGQLHFGAQSSGGGATSGNVTNLNVSGNLVHTGLSVNLGNLVVTGSTTLNNPVRLQNLPQIVTGNALYINTASGTVSSGRGFYSTSSANGVPAFGVDYLTVSGNLTGLSASTLQNYVAVETSSNQLYWRAFTGSTTSSNYTTVQTTTVSTTSTTYVTVLTLTVPAGTYLVAARATIFGSHPSALQQLALFVDGTMRNPTERLVQAAANYDSTICLSSIETFSASATITLRYKINSPYTVSLRTGILQAIRLS